LVNVNDIRIPYFSLVQNENSAAQLVLARQNVDYVAFCENFLFLLWAQVLQDFFVLFSELSNETKLKNKRE
jgi:hypothetical protein